MCQAQGNTLWERIQTGRLANLLIFGQTPTYLGSTECYPSETFDKKIPREMLKVIKEWLQRLEEELCNKQMT